MDFSKLKITEDASRQSVNEPPFHKEVIFKGEELVGLEYEPVFDFFEGKIANAHKVLDGDFVTTEDGTGIVHIASGFGEDDFNLCKKNGIGVACPVDDGGCFDKNSKDLHEIKYKLGDKEEVLELRGKQVFETNDDVIKYLKSKDLWVKTEQYLHNYPHCWRTDTPLIYKAVSSWYVKVTDFKDRMCELNKQIHWIPEHVRDGQFGKWLENARDWSITRNRFWGAPVPVWRMHYRRGYNIGLPEDYKQATGNKKNVIDEFIYAFQQFKINTEIELDNLIKKSNQHLEIQKSDISNLDDKDILHFKDIDNEFTNFSVNAFSKNDYLIDDGHIHANYEVNADIIFVPSSIRELEDFFRNDYIINFLLGQNSGKYIQDKTVTYKILRNILETIKDDARNEMPDDLGSYLLEAKDDVEFTKRFIEHFPNAFCCLNNFIDEFFAENKDCKNCFKIDDLHRPYIDELVKHTDGGDLRRVDDVLDCWFESGSMPYAQVHYPFEYRDGNGNLIRTAEENKKWFDTHFPCDFVTEYVAQTRGWFYTMVVLATALFDKIPFKNVICHGVMLDKDGQKLSKRLRNYPDPLEMIDIYGSDAMRWLMASSPVVQGGDMRIDKDGKMIADVVKNVLNPIWNAFVFYKQYAELDKIKITGRIDGQNVMDKYILSKLRLFVEQFERAMDAYNTIDACHEVELFIDVLNNWYIRRNKERFWKKEHDADKQQAYEVLHFVLKTFATATAPVLPFLGEEIWGEVLKFE